MGCKLVSTIPSSDTKARRRLPSVRPPRASLTRLPLTICPPIPITRRIGIFRRRTPAGHMCWCAMWTHEHTKATKTLRPTRRYARSTTTLSSTLLTGQLFVLPSPIRRQMVPETIRRRLLVGPMNAVNRPFIPMLGTSPIRRTNGNDLYANQYLSNTTTEPSQFFRIVDFDSSRFRPLTYSYTGRCSGRHAGIEEYGVGRPAGGDSQL